MTAQIIDGKKIAANILADLKTKIEQAGTSFRPCIVAVLIGDNPASQSYIKIKCKRCAEVGVLSKVIELPSDISEIEVINTIHMLNADPSVHGILVQLPLPDHIDSFKIIDVIAPSKDVDGFHPYNLGVLLQRRLGLRPATPKGIMELLYSTGVELKGKHAVILGESNIVGRPMMLELMRTDCTVSICHIHSKSEDVLRLTRQADILVVAIGVPKHVKADWIKPGAIVIDAGFTRTEDGKFVGDVDFEHAKEIAGWITPVPGGVGPMTVAALLENTVKAAVDGF